MNWGLIDFTIMGILISSVIGIFALITKKIAKKYQFAVGMAVLVLFLLIWIHLAVGIVDSWPFAGY